MGRPTIPPTGRGGGPARKAGPNLSRAIGRRRGGALVSALVLMLGVLWAAQGASAGTINCQQGTYYWASQYSNQTFPGVEGNISDPAASHLQGSPSNQFFEAHQLAWMEVLDENPPGPCGADQTQCWIQVGIGTGNVCWNGFNCADPGHFNATNKWQVYFEDIGAGGPSNAVDEFYPNLPISLNSSISFSVSYDGQVGYTGKPQYRAYVVDHTSGGKYVYVNDGELPFSSGHIQVDSEDYTGGTTLCPELATGAPNVNFGAASDGAYNPAAGALELETSPGHWSDWGGAPIGRSLTDGSGPGYYQYVHDANYPGDFSAKGPVS